MHLPMNLTVLTAVPEQKCRGIFFFNSSFEYE